MRNWLLFATIVLVLLVPGASGRTWYVATNSDDNNPGTRSRPLASLGRAVEAARSVPQATARRILIRGDSRLEGNLAVQCPSPRHNHMATNNVIVHNVFVHRGDLRLSFYRCAEHRLERNLIWAEGQIEVFRPEAVSVWDRNLFYSGTGTVLGYKIFAASSANSERSPFCSSTWAATAWGRNRLTM